jgi:hypothetical protein
LVLFLDWRDGQMRSGKVVVMKDTRTLVELSWHTPGAQKVRYIKRVLIDPRAPGDSAALTTFKETITFD